MSVVLRNLAPEVAAMLRHRPDCSAPQLARAEMGKFADPMLLCGRCGGWYAFLDPDAPFRDELLAALNPPEPGAPAQLPPRRALTMACARCGRAFPVRRGRATVPVCPRCRELAEAEKADRARGARSDDARKRRMAHR